MIKCLTPPDVLLVEVGMERWHFQERQCSHKSSDRGEDDVNWEGDGELRREHRLLYTSPELSRHVCLDTRGCSCMWCHCVWRQPYRDSLACYMCMNVMATWSYIRVMQLVVLSWDCFRDDWLGRCWLHPDNSSIEMYT